MKNMTGKAFLAWGLVFAAGILLSTGCASTKQSKDVTPSSFLGEDAGKLVPGLKGQADLRYVNPAAGWTKYKKVLLEPVTFWGGGKGSVPVKDQQILTNYFHQALYNQLARDYEMVTAAGPDVMRIQVAVVEAKAATPGLRTVSVIVPQAHALSTLKELATGSYPFVGEAQAEGKVTDSVSGELLGAAVDKRIGTGAPQAGLQWQLGDAEHAIDQWAKHSAERLNSWTSGKETPA